MKIFLQTFPTLLQKGMLSLRQKGDADQGGVGEGNARAKPGRSDQKASKGKTKEAQRHCQGGFPPVCMSKKQNRRKK